ncbi:hypothetical protein [Lacibacter luteus]|uniref:hypothetical protein n=1 Tax=Lacibacter luteus TaxID=2508719 RepID=UPI0013E916A1|nr:hypothetical protein [Lacibacter luteus]
MKKLIYMAIAFAFIGTVYAGVTADKPKKNKKKTEQCCNKTNTCCKKETSKQ